MNADEVIRLKQGGSLLLYRPPEPAKGVVLICPGGGYKWLSPREGEPVARRFNTGGWAAAVLMYTCCVSEPVGKLPLMQAGEAAARLRELFPGRTLAVCGFSAGGHLAASLGVHWKEEGLSRPDGLILCYPVITAGKYRHRESLASLEGDRRPDYWSLEDYVSDETPPSFIWHTVTDPVVPVYNSILFAEQLAAHHVPVEMHLYPKGTHGLSLATPEVEETEKERFADPHVAGWFNLCLQWLNAL